jgi:hypothetical protein
MVSHNKPSKKINQVQKSVDDILKFDALGQKCDFKVLSDSLYTRLKRKSLIIIVGDFFEIPDFKLLAKKHEVVCVVVRDHLEEKPPKMGFASLVDPESGNTLEGDFNTYSVDSYAKKVQVHDRILYETFRKHQIRFSKVYTDTSASVALRRLFEGR